MVILKEYVFEPCITNFLIYPFVKANILIDGTGHARLADFGLLTVASGGTNITSSNSFLEGGTCRWISPERFDPELFNLAGSRPTECSDCYTFGMVIYEVLGGQIPFSKCHDFAVVAKVMRGERPVRPRGAEGRWFTDDIWSILECCWKPIPGDRLKIKDVLRHLEVLTSWTPPIVQIIADPTAATPPTWDPETSTEESVDGREVVLPEPSQQLRLRGKSNKKLTSPPVDHHSAPLNGPPGHVVMRGMREPPGAVEHLQAIFQTVFEQTDHRKALSAGFFFFTRS